MFSLLIAWFLDILLGDPAWLPHPVVAFGRWISWWERCLNHGRWRMLKGAILAVGSIVLIYLLTRLVLQMLSCPGLTFSLPIVDAAISPLSFLLSVVLIFFCLAGHTLRSEVRAVFLAVDRSLDEGRKQVARIVGRDTAQLSPQQVRTAALETLAENLSDGVVAPLFWLALLGVPGMMAYKMVNTLDSMIGYRTERYRDFGCWAARIDDVANFIPARLTALLMLLPSLLTGRFSLLPFVWKNGRRHASPNSGYPEAALAGILKCRFGGPHEYFGETFYKPYIGDHERPLTAADMRKSLRINLFVEVIMVILLVLPALIPNYHDCFPLITMIVSH